MLHTPPIRSSIQLEFWQHRALGRLTLGPNEWHVWAIDHLANSTESALSREEQETANKFRLARDRDAFISTRVALRHLLASYTDTAPEAVKLVLGVRLKPRLANNELHFNVSHSGGKSLLAFGQSDVGVDMERIRPIPEMEAIVRDSFAPGEYRRWSLLPQEQRAHAFFLGWTRKEAYLKALGEGLQIPLDTFEVSLEPDATAELVNLPDWTLYDFALPEYAAALAIRGSCHTYRAWKLNLAGIQDCL